MNLSVLCDAKMRVAKRMLVCGWMLGMAGALAGQTPDAVPPPQQPPSSVWGTPAKDDPLPPVATIRTTTREVQFDVVVVDDKGRPVTGLKKEDFVLTEGDAAQQIRSFEEHGPVSAADQAKSNAMAKLPPNTFTNFTRMADTNASTVIFIDALDAGIPAQMYLHEQLIEYLKKTRPETPIAIFLLDSRLHLVQGFTSDPQVLMAAVKSKRCEPVVPPLFSAGGGIPAYRFRQDVRTAGMQMLGRYLAAFPGRKNVIWFSGYEPHKILFNTATSNAFPDYGSLNFDMDEFSDALRLSRVAIYPVDAGGLRVDPKFSAETRGRPNLGNMSFENGISAEQQHFDEVAERTGGKAYVNDNGLKDIVAEVVDTGSHYYTITYSPTNRQWYGQFRHIKLETAMSGLHLQYRNGYYARNRMKREESNLVKAKNSTTTGEFHPADEGQPRDQQGVLLRRAKMESLQASMTLGEIPPTELVFNASVAPSSAVEQVDKKEALPPDNYLRAGFAKKPYREVELLYALDTKTLGLTKSADAVRHGEVEFVAVVYSDEGDVVNSLITTATLDLSDVTYKKMLQQGFTMKQKIAVPVKGKFYLRLGVHDVVGDQVGAMEIPMEEVKVGVAGVGLGTMP